jgi:regulator of sirC expression with transglutaminase-like and TPR domain
VLRTKNSHQRRTGTALAALDRILLLDRALEELVERGGLYERLKCFKAALDDTRFFRKHRASPG